MLNNVDILNRRLQLLDYQTKGLSFFLGTRHPYRTKVP